METPKFIYQDIPQENFDIRIFIITRIYSLKLDYGIKEMLWLKKRKQFNLDLPKNGPFLV